ncbi:MAG: site-specific DNA-methyltransferase [Holophagales bacterium]|jgi:adenine-specific DNA-methyltransferase|nr:site-specific DNA-methyltransferase [Holophagales bacterium]
MPTPKKTTKTPKASLDTKTIESFTHDEAKRLVIPTTELSSVARKGDLAPVHVSYNRRDPDLDPQLIWRGKYDADGMDGGELLVRAYPLYIQEKIHPKALIADLRRESALISSAKAKNVPHSQQEHISLFADFNGIPEGVDRTEFYRHEQNWSNRLILGDSLQVMAGLAERERLRGMVQCVYFDPPYGIKFNSNFQWSTKTRDVKDGKADQITREPEQVKAFRDTWKDGIHSYLGYIRDRLIAARDLLTESGSIFVQIGDENVHRVRAVMDEVFGEGNFCATIVHQKTPYATSSLLPPVYDLILWYAKCKNMVKYRELYGNKEIQSISGNIYTDNVLLSSGYNENDYTFTSVSLISPGESSHKIPFNFKGEILYPTTGSHWKVTLDGLYRVAKADRIFSAKNSIRFKSRISDFQISIRHNIWTDTITGSFTENKIYVVQTNPKVIERCLLMTTDPGDLVLDPTCGSGTTAYVAEQWGRRWITIDTSRVALALARSRLMGARYPYYLLSDSPEGQAKEAEITQTPPSNRPAYGNIRHGFVYERVPHITLKSIANNTEIDVIWEKYQEVMEPLRQQLNTALKQKWEEWEVPREASVAWPPVAKELHASWWKARIARQSEIDASIAAKADTEYLFDKPYIDKKKVRVSGPFTVESLQPHRMLSVDENGGIDDPLERAVRDGARDFASMILEELKAAGVQQPTRDGKIDFDSLKPWPGRYICGEGEYRKGDISRRAGIFIGPEFGSVGLEDLKAAAKEAALADFDDLITCAFSFDATTTDLSGYGRVNILKARVNADMHMSTELKNTGKGNLFVVFGEPDIEIENVGENQIRVKINGVDVFDPQKGEVRSDDTDNIACWFIDTDYNEESFFVRRAYFLGANDNYKALQSTLGSEINKEAWDSLRASVSRPFDKPGSGRIAVKVINHLGDEVMKVYRV